MLKKILCIVAALCGFTGHAHGALTYTQTPALFLGGINISTSSMGIANTPYIATNSAGVSVIAWSAPAVKQIQDTYVYWVNGIYLLRYDANGNPLGSLVRIDPAGSSPLTQPKVAIDPLGRYVVIWKYRCQN